MNTIQKLCVGPVLTKERAIRAFLRVEHPRHTKTDLAVARDMAIMIQDKQTQELAAQSTHIGILMRLARNPNLDQTVLETLGKLAIEQDNKELLRLVKYARRYHKKLLKGDRNAEEKHNGLPNIRPEGEAPLNLTTAPQSSSALGPSPQL